MEPKPKERIVFDEDSYYGDEGEEMAINDLMERKGLTEDEVRESFTDDEVFQHAMKLRDFDYEEEMRALTAFFDGKKSDMSDFINPYGGNHIFVAGSFHHRQMARASYLPRRALRSRWLPDL